MKDILSMLPEEIGAPSRGGTVLTAVALPLLFLGFPSYSRVWVAASAVPVWVRPFIFWKAVTALRVPEPKLPSTAPV